MLTLKKANELKEALGNGQALSVTSELLLELIDGWITAHTQMMKVSEKEAAMDVLIELVKIINTTAFNNAMEVRLDCTTPVEFRDRIFVLSKSWDQLIAKRKGSR